MASFLNFKTNKAPENKFYAVNKEVDALLIKAIEASEKEKVFSRAPIDEFFEGAYMQYRHIADLSQREWASEPFVLANNVSIYFVCEKNEDNKYELKIKRDDLEHPGEFVTMTLNGAESYTYFNGGLTDRVLDHNTLQPLIDAAITSVQNEPNYNMEEGLLTICSIVQEARRDGFIYGFEQIPLKLDGNNMLNLTLDPNDFALKVEKGQVVDGIYKKDYDLATLSADFVYSNKTVQLGDIKWNDIRIGRDNLTARNKFLSNHAFFGDSHISDLAETFSKAVNSLEEPRNLTKYIGRDTYGRVVTIARNNEQTASGQYSVGNNTHGQWVVSLDESNKVLTTSFTAQEKAISEAIVSNRYGERNTPEKIMEELSSQYGFVFEEPILSESKINLTVRDELLQADRVFTITRKETGADGRKCFEVSGLDDKPIEIRFGYGDNIYQDNTHFGANGNIDQYTAGILAKNEGFKAFAAKIENFSIATKPLMSSLSKSYEINAILEKNNNEIVTIKDPKGRYDKVKIQIDSKSHDFVCKSVMGKLYSNEYVAQQLATQKTMSLEVADKEGKSLAASLVAFSKELKNPFDLINKLNGTKSAKKKKSFKERLSDFNQRRSAKEQLKANQKNMAFISIIAKDILDSTKNLNALIGQEKNSDLIWKYKENLDENIVSKIENYVKTTNNTLWFGSETRNSDASIEAVKLGAALRDGKVVFVSEKAIIKGNEEISKEQFLVPREKMGDALSNIYTSTIDKIEKTVEMNKLDAEFGHIEEGKGSLDAQVLDSVIKDINVDVKDSIDDVIKEASSNESKADRTENKEIEANSTER